MQSSARGRAARAGSLPVLSLARVSQHPGMRGAWAVVPSIRPPLWPVVVDWAAVPVVWAFELDEEPDPLKWQYQR